MMRDGIFTFLSKLIIALINFIIVIITARYLGAEGRGVISLFILNLSIAMMVSNIAAGPSMVVLLQKYPVAALLRWSYTWSFIASLFISIIAAVFELTDRNYIVHLFLLSLFQAMMNAHLQVLLARFKQTIYNSITIGVAFITIVFMVVFLEMNKIATPRHYLFALYAANILGVILSYVQVQLLEPVERPIQLAGMVPAVFKLGGIVQAANLIQLMNYRLNVFVLEKVDGLAATGYYTTALSIIESTWLLTSGFAIVFFAKASDPEQSKKMTKLVPMLCRWLVFLTGVAAIAICLLSKQFFNELFGRGFAAMKPLLWMIAPGVVIFTTCIIISNYFSAINKAKYSMQGSLMGLVVSAVIGFPLINWLGIKGAALTYSLSLMASSIFMLQKFLRETGANKKTLIAIKDDLASLKQYLTSNLNKL